MKTLYVSNNSLSLQGIYKTKNFSIIILLTMKKTYLVLLACMLSTVAYADNKQTVKIDGNVIDKVVTEITLRVMMLYLIMPTILRKRRICR